MYECDACGARIHPADSKHCTGCDMVGVCVHCHDAGKLCRSECYGKLSDAPSWVQAAVKRAAEPPGPRQFTGKEIAEIYKLLTAKQVKGRPTTTGQHSNNLEALGWQTPWSFDGFNRELIVFLIEALGKSALSVAKLEAAKWPTDYDMHTVTGADLEDLAGRFEVYRDTEPDAELRDRLISEVYRLRAEPGQ